METHDVKVLIDEQTQVLTVQHGANLRQSLLVARISPYSAMTQSLNCGGRGICATCGIRFEAGEPAPTHWHDKLAAAGGYPRLSCQITVEQDMTIRIVTDKVVWGRRLRSHRYIVD